VKKVSKSPNRKVSIFSSEKPDEYNNIEITVTDQIFESSAISEYDINDK
jgi:hypothetical protein